MSRYVQLAAYSFQSLQESGGLRVGIKKTADERRVTVNVMFFSAMCSNVRSESVEVCFLVESAGRRGLPPPSIRGSSHIHAHKHRRRKTPTATNISCMWINNSSAFECWWSSWTCRTRCSYRWVHPVISFILLTATNRLITISA